MLSIVCFSRSLTQGFCRPFRPAFHRYFSSIFFPFRFFTSAYIASFHSRNRDLSELAGMYNPTTIHPTIFNDMRVTPLAQFVHFRYVTEFIWWCPLVRGSQL